MELQNLYSNFKMLFNLLGSKEYKTQPKAIYRNAHPRMLFDQLPSFRHFWWPIDIIKDPYTVVMRSRQ